MFGYIKRVTSGGPKALFHKIVSAQFGLVPLKREADIYMRRSKLLRDFKSDINKTSGKRYPSIENRSELQALLAAPALINDKEIKVFEKYGSLARDSIVEIGCAYGGSSLLFLMYKKDGVEVYSIDPFIQDSMGSFQALEEVCREKVTRALELIGMKDRIEDWRLEPDYSFNVVKNFKKPIEVLFVDGDHRYEAVKKDFEDWFPLVKTGGIVLFHDSARPDDAPIDKALKGWPGPTKLVHEIKQRDDVDFLEEVWSISVFRKK